MVKTLGKVLPYLVCIDVPATFHSAPYSGCPFLPASWFPTIEHLRRPGSSVGYKSSSPSGSLSFLNLTSVSFPNTSPKLYCPLTSRKPWASEILISGPTYLLSFVIAISTISFAGDFQGQLSIDREVLHLFLLHIV